MTQQAHQVASLVAHILEDIDDESWQDLALCAETDPECFYPEKGGSVVDAKAVCARCDVKTECLEYALAHNEMHGIWGGLSTKERLKILRMRRGPQLTVTVESKAILLDPVRVAEILAVGHAAMTEAAA